MNERNTRTSVTPIDLLSSNAGNFAFDLAEADSSADAASFFSASLSLFSLKLEKIIFYQRNQRAGAGRK